ncbi:hypothetical protein LSAT2_011974 [Lamellibrachia satsuma]|nr:hypothetical protein LSAT2_011974 [Lamellibrachia satsuma]
MDGEPSEVLTTSITTSNSTLSLNGPIFNLSSLTSDGDKTDYSSEGIKFEVDAVTTAGLIGDSGVIGVETSQGLVLSVGDSITVGQVSLAGATNTLDLQNTVYLPAHFLNADGAQLFEVQGDATGDSCQGLTTGSPPQLHSSLSDTVAVKRKGGWPKGRKRKKEKLFQGPKSPASAYVIFAIERRRQIKEMTPELPFVEVTKLLGGEWSSMCPVEKQKYVELAESDKQRYIDELKLYQQSDAYQNFLKRKRALCEEDSPSLDIIDTTHYLDNIEEEEGLYCKVCDQYFSNMHNRKGASVRKTTSAECHK